MILIALLAATAVSVDLPHHEYEAVLVDRAGAATRQTVTLPLAPEVQENIAFAWLWNADSPPTRFTRDALPSIIPPKEYRALQVHVREAAPPRGLQVVAAPARMWEEVAEDLLPHFDVHERTACVPAEDGPLRLRAYGRTVSSIWTDIAAGSSAATLGLLPAIDVSVTIEPGEAQLELLGQEMRLQSPRTLAVFATRNEKVRIPAAPAISSLAVITAPHHVPLMITTGLQSLPSTIVLDAGASMSGRVLSRTGEAQGEVTIRAESWIGVHTAVPWRAETVTDDQGSWTLHGVPMNVPIAVSARTEKSVATAQVQADQAEVNLGDLVLASLTGLTLSVRTAAGAPVENARVRGRQQDAVTNAAGVVRLEELAAGAELTIAVEAPGYLRAVETLRPPIPSRHELRLQESFRLTGQVTDSAGMPLAGSALTVRAGARVTSMSTEPNGTFDLDLKPDTPFELGFGGSATSEVRVNVEPGRPGELRDLGQIVLPSGLSVQGRVINSAYETLDATVWALRPTMQPNLAFARGEKLEARTAADGTFDFTGVTVTPLLLRIDSPGYARRFVTVEAIDAESIDLGDLVLVPGATLEIASEQGTLAKLALDGMTLDADQFVASLIGGRAELRHVPEGPALLSILEGLHVLCEERVDVPGQGALTVRCEERRRVVHGSVHAGGRAANGMLLWKRPMMGDSVIMNRTSAMGVPHQDVLGVRSSRVITYVSDGEYSTEKLLPGPWSVTWLPDGGGSTPAREIELRDVEVQRVPFVFGAVRLQGIVVSAAEVPVPRASVMARGLTGGVVTAEDGTFVLEGLEPGEYYVRAREGSQRTSPEVLVRLRDGNNPQIRLVLQVKSNEVTVRVRRVTGEPAAGTAVLLDYGGGMNMTTTNLQGAAVVRLPDEAERLRGAATEYGRWVFGGDFSATSTELHFRPVGNLRIEETEPAAFRLLTPTGWDVTGVLAQLGVRLETGRTITGLPVGTYTVFIKGRQLQMVVKEGQTVIEPPR